MVSARSDRPRIRSLLAAAALLAGLAGCASGTDEGGPAADVPGITAEPCPKAVNRDHGCIYLGIISDLTTGPFTGLGVPMVTAQKAFWDRVNRQGGIGGYDVDVHTYIRDNKYDPATHRSAYIEIKDKVLALAQSLGSPTTEAILGDLRAARMIAVPGSYPSRWEFEDVILESGASYCFEAMNAIDYAVDTFQAESVLAVYYPGDYGGEGAAGARLAATARGLRYSEVETQQGAAKQAEAVRAILERRPDVVMLTVGPAETAAIAGKAVEAGFQGRFMGSNPTWVGSLLKTPAAEVLKARYLVVAPWKTFPADSPGHTAMRLALGQVEPDNALTSGWIFQYPLKTVLEKAAANGDLTREGVYEALRQVTTVDYEGMLPRKAGNFSGSPNAAAFRESVVGRPDEREFTGVKVITDFISGPTATGHNLASPCYAAG
ncbi:ABC transporter substrate-binding protein [Actinomadura sp. 7K534]|uniref:ABC transporter substrate-binding protein n=1 Tax=Actinomadura sp. 7K534 TaxID=2530366 RepID=UPI00104EC258|nr:ABC transporter substrate-binding protein [Actinomadura sp. 7K534]TDB97519.1 ABC transporter substrate-binding protein [Actinomadura sp. 7K534]